MSSSFPLFVTATPTSSATSSSTSLTTFPPRIGVTCQYWTTCSQRRDDGLSFCSTTVRRNRGHYTTMSSSTNSEWINSKTKAVSLRVVGWRSDGNERRGSNDDDDDDARWTISNVIVPSDGYPTGHGQGSNYDAFSPLKSTIETSFGKVLDELGNVMEGGPTFSSCRDFVTLVLYLKWCNVPAFKIIDLLLSSTSSSSPSPSPSPSPSSSLSSLKKPSSKPTSRKPRPSTKMSSHATKSSASSLSLSSTTTSNNPNKHPPPSISHHHHHHDNTNSTNDFVQPMIHHIYAVDYFCLSRERHLQDGAVASWVRGRVEGRRPMHAFSRSQIKRYSAMYRTVCDELPATVSWSLLFFNKLTQAAQGDVGTVVVGSGGSSTGSKRRGSGRRGACLPRTWEDLLAYIVLSCRYTLNS